jgi:hypothetical protein
MGAPLVPRETCWHFMEPFRRPCPAHWRVVQCRPVGCDTTVRRGRRGGLGRPIVGEPSKPDPSADCLAAMGVPHSKTSRRCRPLLGSGTWTDSGCGWAGRCPVFSAAQGGHLVQWSGLVSCGGSVRGAVPPDIPRRTPSPPTTGRGHHVRVVKGSWPPPPVGGLRQGAGVYTHQHSQQGLLDDASQGATPIVRLAEQDPLVVGLYWSQPSVCGWLGFPP